MSLTITDLMPAYGALVEGLDPSAPLDRGDEALLQRTFDERGLLVIRDLPDLPAPYQRYLASAVIGMEDAAGAGDKDDDGAYYVSNKRSGGGAPFGRLLYHADMMWAEAPFQVLSLYAVDVQPPAVPTTFTSATAAWDSLPADLQHRVESLHAVHETGQQARAAATDSDLLQPVRTQVRSATKPIANRHPRTGRTILYVSQMMTSRVDELADAESEELLGAVFDHLYDPSRVWTHEWRNGDLVMWDNLAMQHARGNVDAEGPVRTLRKVIAPRPSLERIESPKFTKAG